MTTKPPGWYDDGNGAMRWWDGAHWTEHVTASDPVDEAGGDELPPELTPESGVAGDGAGPYTGEGAFAAATDTGGGSTRRVVWVVVGILLLAVVAVAAVLIPLLLLA